MFAQTVMNDPAYADRVAAAYRPSSRDRDTPGPSLTEFGSIEALLASVVDAVEALHISFVRANMDPDKGNPPKFKPYPRPKTLVQERLDRAKQDARWQRHNALVRMVLPVDSDPD